MIRIKSILILCILAIFASCSKEDNPTNNPGFDNPGTGSDDKLIVMSYNIRHCAPYYGTSETTAPDVNSIATIIKGKKPDVVLLQEVDKCTTRSLGIDQAKEIAKLAGYPYYYFFKSMDYREGEFGLAIMSQTTLQDSYGYILPKQIDGVTIDGDFVIGTSKIKRNGKDITLAVAHLSLTQSERDKQMSYVIDKILSKQSKQVVFGGDFNATPTNNTISILDNAGYVRTNTNAKNFTIPSNAPNREIDYITYFPATAFSVVSNTVLTGLNASDHLPIISIIKIVK